MKKGTVKWFNRKKGYGFIVAEDNSEVFVHYSNINMDGYKALSTGDQVSYEEGTDENGRMLAVNVTKEQA